MLYVGTHRRAHHADLTDVAFGIYAFRELAGDAGFAPASLTETPQPGWIAAHPNGRFLYAVNEVGSLDGMEGGAVSAFAVDRASGALTFLNRHLLPPMPCHCAVDATGGYLLVATFGGGSVHLFPLDADGSIGSEADGHRHVGSSIHPRRQTGPHAHAMAIAPGNRLVLVPDLGTDQLLVYELDHARAKLVPRSDRTVGLPPGAGPRHVTFTADGRFAYLINEMNATITAFALEADGALLKLQTADLLPQGFSGLRSGAAVAVHPSGRFLYATTRSHGSSGMPPEPGLDNLVWFRIDPANGTLEAGGRVMSGGGIPRSMILDPAGDRLLVAHQCSGTIVAFDLEPSTGRPGAPTVVLRTPVPVCLLRVDG